MPLVYIINQIKNSKNNEQINTEQNEIKSQINERLINNLVNNLNPEDYIIEMFGQFGWVCRNCNNFNFESRKKCNKCHIIKMPKMKNEIIMKKVEIKIDWYCLNCKNLNYFFKNI